MTNAWIADSIVPNTPIDNPQSLKAANLYDMSGKVALVTGGSSGVGRMIAAAFVANGVRTYIAARKPGQLDKVAAELNEIGTCHAISCDLGDMDGVKDCAARIAEREPALNILVNNTGAFGSGSADTFTPVAWDKVFDLNVKSTFFLTQALIRQLSAGALEDDWARVVNLSSIGAHTTSLAGPVAYGPSKIAVEQLTRILGRQLAPHRVACNAIAPGWFPAKRNAPQGVEAAEAWIASTPLGRLGTMQDMAGLAIFLCSRAGSYINGQTITIDGGKSL